MVCPGCDRMWYVRTAVYIFVGQVSVCVLTSFGCLEEVLRRVTQTARERVRKRERA